MLTFNVWMRLQHHLRHIHKPIQYTTHTFQKIKFHFLFCRTYISKLYNFSTQNAIDIKYVRLLSWKQKKNGFKKNLSSLPMEWMMGKCRWGKKERIPTSMLKWMNEKENNNDLEKKTKASQTERVLKFFRPSSFFFYLFNKHIACNWEWEKKKPKTEISARHFMCL